MRRARLLRSVVAIALALLVPCGAGVLPGPRAVAAEPVRLSVAIEKRKVDASQRTIRVTQGATVEIAFTGDEPAELHLHGYDRTLELVPGAPAVLKLDARIAGRFAIEAHRFGSAGAAASGKRGQTVLLYLEVHPR
jgi:hypothetical protein